VDVGLNRLINRSPANFKNMFNKICLEQNLAPKYASKSNRIYVCIKKIQFNESFYNTHDILKYGSITVTIQYFMTLYIVSPNDDSVRAETCCVAVP
jgi:hypothetical protein